jgi:hypothetical protein
LDLLNWLALWKRNMVLSENTAELAMENSWLQQTVFVSQVHVSLTGRLSPILV